MSKTIDILKANKSDTGFVWQKEARDHIENWEWMKYSTQIALKVRKRMKALNLTQASLASKMGCTQQYISLLLKGRENLTLETISKLETSLGITLMIVPSSPVNGYEVHVQESAYLSDASADGCETAKVTIQIA